MLAAAAVPARHRRGVNWVESGPASADYESLTARLGQRLGHFKGYASAGRTH